MEYKKWKRKSTLTAEDVTVLLGGNTARPVVVELLYMWAELKL
jgi:hypothetical protein